MPRNVRLCRRKIWKYESWDSREVIPQGEAKHALSERTNWDIKRNNGTEQGSSQKPSYIGRELLLVDGEKACLVGTLDSQLVESHPERVLLHAVPADKERGRTSEHQTVKRKTYLGARMARANEPPITRPSSSAYVGSWSLCVRLYST